MANCEYFSVLTRSFHHPEFDSELHHLLCPPLPEEEGDFEFYMAANDASFGASSVDPDIAEFDTVLAGITARVNSGLEPAIAPKEPSRRRRARGREHP